MAADKLNESMKRVRNFPFDPTCVFIAVRTCTDNFSLYEGAFKSFRTESITK